MLPLIFIHSSLILLYNLMHCFSCKIGHCGHAAFKNRILYRCSIFSSPVRQYRELFSSLTSASALASHFKVLLQSFFYVMGKALPCKLSCNGTNLVVKECTVPLALVAILHTLSA